MLRGLYQQRSHSRQVEAHLAIDDRGRVSCAEATIEAIPLHAIAVSPRIGDTRRHLGFPDGGSFETGDNETVDAWVRRHGHGSRRGLLLHRLDASFGYVLVAVLVTVLGAYAVVGWGLPWLSRHAAFALPPAVSAALGGGSLELLDEHLLEASRLPAQRQRELADLLARLRPSGEDYAFRLVLRAGGPVGANAFALPDGTLVLTDELIELAGDDARIGAVMLHEIGHVVGRHGLRAALQNAGLATLLVIVAGDVASADSLLFTVPTLLVRTAYSREMETEADLYATRAMQARRMDPRLLLEMLQRLEQAHATAAGGADRRWLDYLSTHPVGEARLRPLREALGH